MGDQDAGGLAQEPTDAPAQLSWPSQWQKQMRGAWTSTSHQMSVDKAQEGLRLSENVGRVASGSALVHDLAPRVRIQSGQGVIQQDDVCSGEACAGKRHPLLLTATQIDALRSHTADSTTSGT